MEAERPLSLQITLRSQSWLEIKVGKGKSVNWLSVLEEKEMKALQVFK